jgi:hypothetical protein
MAAPHGEFEAFLEREKPTTLPAAVDLLSDVFLQGDISPDDRKKLIDFVSHGDPKDADRQRRLREAAHALMTMPEFSLA